VAETGSMVEILRNLVRSFFRAEYCLITATSATGLIKARPIRLHRDLDGQMYGSTIRPSDERLVNPSPLGRNYSQSVCGKGRSSKPLARQSDPDVVVVRA
jgi:hypothetical protein